jgi:hypothetical protein
MIRERFGLGQCIGSFEGLASRTWRFRCSFVPLDHYKRGRLVRRCHIELIVYMRGMKISEKQKDSSHPLVLPKSEGVLSILHHSLHTSRTYLSQVGFG